MVHQAKAVA